MTGIAVVKHATLAWSVLTTITLVTGVMFVIWLGEQITEYGIGNGISLIILIGIIERLPEALWNIFQLVEKNHNFKPTVLFLIFITIVIFIITILVETAQRELPIHYTKKVIDQNIYNQQMSFLPIKIDQSGVMAIIFTVSVLAIPLTIAQIFPQLFFLGYPISKKILFFYSHMHNCYNIVYSILVIFFCYFYNLISFNPSDIAQHLRKCNGFIPGIRSGEQTRIYLKHIIDRLTLFGALFVSLITILPDYLRKIFNVPYLFSGTSFLITVGITLEIIAQIKSYYVMKNYENFMINSNFYIDKVKKYKRNDNAYKS
jgi:preprotein translocase subunit SecY